MFFLQFLKHRLSQIHNASYSKSGNQLIQIGRTVRRTHFHRLFLCSIIMTWGLQRICQHAHIRFCRPAQRNAYQYRTVAVAPANVGRCFLMRNQTKIGSRIVLPKAVMEEASFIMPAMALQAVSESAPSFSIWFCPSFMIRICICNPEPAFPAVIFGAKVMLYPYC